MRPPSSSKPRSPTTDAIQLQGRRTRQQALLPRTTPSPRLASPGRGLLRRPGADGATSPRSGSRGRRWHPEPGSPVSVIISAPASSASPGSA